MLCQLNFRLRRIQKITRDTGKIFNYTALKYLKFIVYVFNNKLNIEEVFNSAVLNLVY